MGVAAVLECLSCPMCAGALSLDDALRCARGHSFDVAKQGYVSLLSGAAKPGANADSVAMVQARTRFQDSGAYGRLAAAIAERAGAFVDGPLLDVGAGTGYYLKAALGERVAIAADISKAAAKGAARVDARIASLVVDARASLPIRDHSMAGVLNVFAPRNAAEFRRVLRRDGTLLVVTPAQDHLVELVAALPMLTVDEHKLVRLDAAMTTDFVLGKRSELRFDMMLSGEQIRDVIAMGPSAHHVDLAALAQLPARSVRAAFVLSEYRPKME